MPRKRQTKAITADEYQSRLPADQQKIVASLRGLIRNTAPELQETVKWGTPCYVGRGNVCSIMAFREHVNLAFFHGTRLADKDGLLEGTGKGMRHVKFGTVKETRRRGVAALIREAAELECS